jgi:Mn-dependent DtxR family transcriptional regulator
MNVHESGEMYLEAILVLSKQNPFVRSVDVSEYLGYSKPSVSRAMGLLREGDLIRMEKDGGLYLTENGQAIAEKIYERHTVLTQVLVGLGVPTEIAAEDACRIEHHISDVTFEAIKRHVSEAAK